MEEQTALLQNITASFTHVWHIDIVATSWTLSLPKKYCMQDQSFWKQICCSSAMEVSENAFLHHVTVSLFHIFLQLMTYKHESFTGI